MEDLTRLRRLVEHVQEAQTRYPLLRLIEQDGELKVEGPIAFCMGDEGDEICDSYNVRIVIPTKYPEEPPFVFDASGRIRPDFHTNGDGTLCLEVPIQVRRKFRENPTLLSFIEKLLVPFLYGHSYFVLRGSAPYGERPHNEEGLLDFYTELFSCGAKKVLRILRGLADRGVLAGGLCACGSRKTLADCHGDLIAELSRLEPSRFFSRELKAVRRFVKRKARARTM